MQTQENSSEFLIYIREESLRPPTGRFSSVDLEKNLLQIPERSREWFHAISH